MKLYANPYATGVCGLLAGVGCGILVGIQLGNRRSRAEFDKELDELKSHYNSRIKAAVASVRNEFAAVVIAGGNTGTAEEVGVADGAVADGGDSDTADAELDRLPAPGGVVLRDREERQAAVAAAPERDRSRPYVISHEEYYEDELGFQKLALTYYSNDKILVDHQDAPIPNTAEIVGIGFEQKFGELSGDPHIVHIRNEKIEADMEISVDLRSFADVVLGYGNPANVRKTVRRERPDE